MPIYEDGYLNWSHSQNSQVKSKCPWGWGLQRIYGEIGISTMSRSVGSTGHKINELALRIRNSTGKLPELGIVDQWSDKWFEYYIEKDGHRLLSYEKEYYKSDIDCINDYAALSRQLCRKCIKECTPKINPLIIDRIPAIEQWWEFDIQELKIKMRGRFDVIEIGNIVSDLKFKGAKPLIKKGQSGANRSGSIEGVEQYIIYSAAKLTETGEYPIAKQHGILHQKKQDIYEPLETRHNDDNMQTLFNVLKGVKPLIDEAVNPDGSAKNPDILLPASDFSYLCSEDCCDYWKICDKHY